MKLLTLGINHHTAPVDVREKVAFDPEYLQEALHDLRQHLSGVSQSGLPEATILSTCNRTELYCAANDADSTTLLHNATFDWLAKSLYCRLMMHRDNPLRDKQIRQNRRINKLICRGLSREKIFPNWKVGYF